MSRIDGAVEVNKQVGEITSELDHLDQIVDKVSAIADCLCARLEPVLLAAPPVGEEKSVGELSCCVVSKRIQVVRGRLTGIFVALSDTSDRLGV
jgi:hypothetical protein